MKVLVYIEAKEGTRLQGSLELLSAANGAGRDICSSSRR